MLLAVFEETSIRIEIKSENQMFWSFQLSLYIVLDYLMDHFWTNKIFFEKLTYWSMPLKTAWWILGIETEFFKSLGLIYAVLTETYTMSLAVMPVHFLRIPIEFDRSTIAIKS